MSFNQTVKLQKKHRFILFVVLALLVNTSPAEVGSNWIEQWGIRWTFDKDISPDGTAGTYHYGQFVNGDYWVVGPVKIIAINPPSETINGRVTNGSQINPTNNWEQGYDAVAPWYNSAINVGEGISTSTPLSLAVHSSLVSSKGLSTPTNLTQIEDAAVLTVLPEAASGDAFRPPYCGTDKSILYTKASLDYGVLKSLAPVAGTPGISSAEQDYERVRIDHAPVPHGQKIRPLNNYNGSVYGREIAKTSAHAALLLNLDYTNEEKETLLIRYVQYGIDLHGIIQTDGEGWHGDGGHSGGRKLPILFAGSVLHDSSMLSIGQISGQYLYTGSYGPGNRPPDYKDFGEDAQTFYVDQFYVDLTHNTSWWAPDSRDTAIPYETSDIGLPEWSQTHSHAPKKCTNWWDAIYREVGGCSFPGTAIAARIMGLESLWNNPAFFDYSDRYMNIITTDSSFAGWQSGTNGVEAFVMNMWDTYRTDYGAVWPDDSGSSETTYVLSVSAPNGSVELDPAATTYIAGTTVTLTASANDGYEFAGWSGDLSGTTSPISITMDGNKNVTASFSQVTDPGNGGSTGGDTGSTKSLLSPIAKWNFNEKDGVNINDASGNQLHGTLNATVQRTTDMGSVAFNGTDSYINCGNNDLFNLGSSMAISLWVKIDDPELNEYMCLISKKTAWNGESGYAIEYNPAVNRLLILGSGSDYARAEDVNLDTGWHHIVTVIEDTQATLYVDGVDRTSTTSVGRVIDNDVQFEIGREHETAEYYKGEIDDLSIYNQALTESDVLTLFNKGRNDGLSSQYLLDDMEAQLASDNAGCQLDGTLLNTPTWGWAWAAQECLYFDGDNQAIEIQTHGMQVESGTIAMLVEPASDSGPQFLFGHVLDQSNMIWLYTVSGQLALAMGDNSTTATDIAKLSAGEIYHVALTWDGSTYGVYVDGSLAASGPYSGLNNLAATADIANMGTDTYRAEGLGFEGSIDDVQIYNRSLSADEIKALALTQQTKENRELAFTIYGENQDGVAYTYTADALPTGATFDSTTQQFTWRPWYNQSGEHHIRFTSQDGTDEQTVTVSAQDVVISDWYRDFLDQQGKF